MDIKKEERKINMNKLVIGIVGGIVLLMILPTSVAMVLLGVGAFAVGFGGFNVFQQNQAQGQAQGYEYYESDEDKVMTRADFRSEEGYQEHLRYQKFLEWEEEQENMF